MTQAVDNAGTQPSHSVLQDRKPPWIAIACHDRSLFFMSSAIKPVFPPGAAQASRIFSVGLGSKLTGDHRARILNVAMAPVESIRRQCVKFYKVRVARHRPWLRIKLNKLFATDF
jgi:hypothetical protein